MTTLAVLDASAILAVLNDEPGSEVVEPLLPRSVISSVNWLEVIQKMIPLGVSHDALRRSLPDVEVAGFFEPHAAVAAKMREATSHLGASLADRCCSTLALFRDAPVFTADRNMARADVGVDIQLIR